ncbi:MAG: hypothetical protein ABR915_04080 [Thermoguttaceae bacterium]|jgi:hypothetical protein
MRTIDRKQTVSRLKGDPAGRAMTPCGLGSSRCRRGRPRQGTLVLVERPRRWAPTSVWDMPRRALVVDLVNHAVADPATYVRQYNALSLDESGTTWAALTLATAAVGTLVDLLRLDPE